jgi:hypothetical protein
MNLVSQPGLYDKELGDRHASSHLNSLKEANKASKREDGLPECHDKFSGEHDF